MLVNFLSKVSTQYFQMDNERLTYHYLTINNFRIFDFKFLIFDWGIFSQRRCGYGEMEQVIKAGIDYWIEL